MLEVQVLEVQRTRLLDLGVQLPTQMSLTPLSANGTNLTLQDLKSINSSRVGVGISGTTINAQQEYGTVDLLANPRIRVRNREKAEIMIGDKVPGGCESGALSAGVSAGATPYVSQDVVVGTMESAVIGGTASVAAGGKFANGAQTAAFGYLFNGWSHLVMGKIAQDVLYEEKLRDMRYAMDVNTANGVADYADPSGNLGELKPVSYMSGANYNAAIDQLAGYQAAKAAGSIDWETTLGGNTITLDHTYFGISVSATYVVDPRGSGVLFYSYGPVSADYSWLRQMNRIPRKGSASVFPPFGSPAAIPIP